MSIDTAKEHAHHRLLNAVIGFIGADQNGSRAEVRAAATELEAAKQESQKLLYPEESPNREENRLNTSPYFSDIQGSGEPAAASTKMLGIVRRSRTIPQKVSICWQFENIYRKRSGLFA